MTRIGEAKANLTTAIRGEFEDFRKHLDELAAWSTELSNESTGINGLAGFWRSLGQQIESLGSTIAEREAGVLAALEGKSKHEIQISVDPDQVEKVRSARMEEQREQDGEFAA